MAFAIKGKTNTDLICSYQISHGILSRSVRRKAGKDRRSILCIANTDGGVSRFVIGNGSHDINGSSYSASLLLG
jgi:hypothetical protein